MEKGKISALEMAVILYPAIIATAILSIPSTTAQFAGNDLWMSPMIASFAGFLAVYVAVQLHRRFPGKTIIQFSEEIIGKIPGKAVSFFILLFYLNITGSMTRNYSEFIVTSFLLKTPEVVVIGSLIFLCALCAYGGLEVLGRCAQLLFPFFVFPILISLIFLAPDFEPGNIFPILSKGILPPIKGAVPPSGYFAEFFIIAFLLPFLKERKKAMKYGVFTVLGVTVSLVLVNLIVLFVLGETTVNKTYPLMNVGRYANLGGFFENMEAVIMAVWIAGAFVKISVFYYVTALGTAQWLNLSDFRPVVWPLGVLIVEFSFWDQESTMSMGHYDTKVFPFSSLTIQILIPILLLAIAMIFKRKKKKT